jgi:hypothetical protein
MKIRSAYEVLVGEVRHVEPRSDVERGANGDDDRAARLHRRQQLGRIVAAARGEGTSSPREAHVARELVRESEAAEREQG